MPSRNPRIEKPGKFEGELNLTRVVYDMSLDGGADEEAGDSSEAGWVGLMVGITVQEIVEAAFGETTAFPEHPILREFNEVKAPDGNLYVVLFERTDGFVEADYFDTEEEARGQFEEIAENVGSEEGDDDDDDPKAAHGVRPE